MKKGLIALTTFLVVGIILGSLSITFDYPVSDICDEIRQFKVFNGIFPDNLTNLNSYKDVRVLSILKYRTSGDDFLFYFCPTRMGPCEVCTNTEDPHFDEI